MISVSYFLARYLLSMGTFDSGICLGTWTTIKGTFSLWNLLFRLFYSNSIYHYVKNSTSCLRVCALIDIWEMPFSLGVDPLPNFILKPAFDDIFLVWLVFYLMSQKIVIFAINQSIEQQFYKIYSFDLLSKIKRILKNCQSKKDDIISNNFIFKAIFFRKCIRTSHYTSWELIL